MFWKRVVMTIAGCTLGGVAYAQAPVTTGKVLILRQSVSGPDAGAASTSFGRAASALPTQRSVTLDLDGRPIATPEAAGTLPVRDFGVGLTVEHVETQSNTIFTAALPGLTTALRNYMRANGYVVTFYDFVQTVRVAGAAGPRFLTWSMVLYLGQRPVFRAPKILDGQQRSLHMVYTPRAVAAGLPVEWNYPNAGMLHYRVVDRAGATVVDWTDEDVAGAYDAPPIVNGVITDPDAGLKCLMARLAGCPAGVVNAQDVMNRVGLPGAVVDYRRAIAPVYDQVAVTAADGTRGIEQRARSAVTVTRRIFSATGCRGTYRNAGTFGFLLEERTDRYNAPLNGPYALLQQFASSNISPTATYDLSKDLADGSSVATLADKIIDFTNASNPLLTTATVPGLVSVAPITITGGSFGDTMVVADYHYGECGRAIVLRASCNASGNIELQIGTTSDVPACTRGTSFNHLIVNTTLINGVPVPRMFQSDTGGEFPRGFAWQYDGSRIIFDYTPTSPFSWQGSRPGMNPFVSHLFAPSKGYFEKQNFPNGGPISFFYRRGGSCPAGQVSGFLDDANTNVTPAMDPNACYLETNVDIRGGGESYYQVCTLDQSRRIGRCDFYRATGIAAVPNLLQN